MANLTSKNSNWDLAIDADSTQDKKILLTTQGKYIDKNINLTINKITAGEGAANSASLSSNGYYSGGKIASTSDKVAITDTAGEGYYQLTTSGSSKIKTAGWMPEGSLPAGTKNYYIKKATSSSTNGSASATATAGTASISKAASASATITSSLGQTSKPSGTEGTDYWTVSASAGSGVATATGGTASASVTASSVTVSDGYNPSSITKSTTASSTGEKKGNTATTTESTASATRYILKSTTSKTNATASASVNKEPSASASVTSSGIATSTSDTGYSVTASASAASGTATASVTASSASVGAGYNPSAVSTSTEGKSATSTEKTASDSKTIYIKAATTGTSNSGTKVSDINPSTSDQYINITSGYTPAKNWIVKAVSADTAKAVLGNATFANSATSGTTYTDYSASAPVLVSNDYLYINEGYTPARKISLAKLVPDNASGATAIRDGMLQTVSAYDNDGKLITGNIANGSFTNNTSGGTSSGTINAGSQLKISKGWYSQDYYYTAQAASDTTKATVSANSPTITPTIASTVTNGTTNYAITGSATTSVSVNTAGYISSGAGTKNTGTASINGSVAQSTFTKGVTIPSGASSIETLAHNQKIKIGAGYYPTDRYYTIQTYNANSFTTGTYTASNAVTSADIGTYRYLTIAAAATPSLSITDKASTNITIGTLKDGYYPLTTSLTGSITFGTAGWIATTGASATDSSVTVGRIAAAAFSNIGTPTTNSTTGAGSGYIPLVTTAGYSPLNWINTVNIPNGKTLSTISVNGAIGTLNNYGTISTLAQTGTITTLSGNQTISKVSGTITATVNSAATGNININAYNNASTPVLTGSKTIVVNGKWSNSALASLDSNLTAANIKSGVTIFGITGTYNNEAHSSYTPSSTYFTTTSNSLGSITANKYATSTYYIKAGTAGAVTGGEITGSNVTLSNINNGILISRAVASYSISTAGWINSAGTSLAASDKYITDITVPVNTIFELRTSSATSLTAIPVNIFNGKNRLLNVYNSGVTNCDSSSYSSELKVNAKYDDGIIEDIYIDNNYISIVENGKWITKKLDLSTPTGSYYGKIDWTKPSGVRLATPTVGTNSFWVEVPNGNDTDYIRFVFAVDKNGNITIDTTDVTGPSEELVDAGVSQIDIFDIDDIEIIDDENASQQNEEEIIIEENIFDDIIM